MAGSWVASWVDPDAVLTHMREATRNRLEIRLEILLNGLPREVLLHAPADAPRQLGENLAHIFGFPERRHDWLP